MASNAEVLEKVGEVAVSVARIEQRMIRYDEISAELTKAIKGNGKPGLLDRVTVIENCHAAEEKQKAEKKETKDKWGARAWAIASAVIVYVITNIFVVVGIFQKLQTLK